MLLTHGGMWGTLCVMSPLRKGGLVVVQTMIKMQN